MTTTNPLVAGPVEMSTPFTGAFLLEDGEALASAIENGDWVQGGLAAFSAAVDTVAAVSDPLGSLIASGLGWVMEHIEPLKGWMNDLTGDAGEVAGFAQTWRNVGQQLGTSGADLGRILADLDDMDGQAIEAYRAFQRDAATHVEAAGTWSNAMATGLEICSTIVKMVHDITRDAIAEIVGAVISYAAELAFSLGLATPLVIEQVTTRVASLATRVGKSVTRLLESGKALKSLLDQLEGLFKQASALFDRLLHGKPPEMPVIDNRPYLKPGSRPSFRKGVVEKVWDNAKGPDGVVRDPHPPYEVIEWTPGTPRKGVWDMGHLSEQKYSEIWADYKAGKMTKEEFVDWYNNPEHYRPEVPIKNQSHKHE